MKKSDSFTAYVTIAEIRNALANRDLEDISTLTEEDGLNIEMATIAQDDIDAACSLCKGEGIPEPEAVVDPNLIEDFIASIRGGDFTTARAIVGRVFGEMSDVAIVDNAICRCAA